MPGDKPLVSENVKVVVRCRPMNEKEMAASYKNIVEVLSHAWANILVEESHRKLKWNGGHHTKLKWNDVLPKKYIINKVDSVQGSLTVWNPNGSEEDPPKMFTFDTVFGPDSKQLDVYNQAARPIVENVLEGYNGTIFAYGQTGTGKTFTMEGVRTVPELKGIIPNSFAHIFGHIAKAEDDKKFLVRASYLEIYNEEVRDLLGKDQNIRLEVKERPDVGVYVKDLSTFVVNTADELDRIMTLGNKNRAVGATNMNAHSSRSHAIFSITVECSEKGVDGQQHVLVGKLHLVDLAGSERQSKTGASGQRLKEATKINLSLSTLGNVISALVDGKSTHVPYRNSKLTRLLQDSLGGNSKTLMCANVGPAEYNYDETISTLRYANRAKNIKNKARINEDPKDALLRKFQKEIEDLRKQLAEGSEASETGDSATEKSGSEDEDNIDGIKKEKKKKVHRKKGLSEEKMKEIQDKIEADRTMLAEKKDMAEEERNRLATELEQRESELGKARQEHDGLFQKLQALEKKIIVGGENLLEKAEEQERLLEESARELEERKKKEAELRQALQQKEAERLNIEEKYSTLQEEAAGKTKKLKKVWQMQLSAKNELNDLQQEHQREMEGLLENIRQLNRELRLNELIIDSFIPPEYQDIIEHAVQWNEDIGEWQLKCVAYTGNNMRKQTSSADKERKKEVNDLDLSHLYLSYAPDVAQVSMRQKSSHGKSGRSRSARPKSSRSLMNSLELGEGQLHPAIVQPI